MPARCMPGKPYRGWFREPPSLPDGSAARHGQNAACLRAQGAPPHTQKHSLGPGASGGAVTPVSTALKTRILIPLSHQQVSFPANANSDCYSNDPDCGSDGFCQTCPSLAEAHDSCHNYSGERFEQDADGTITTSFSARVAASAGHCCQANSCVGAYFESQHAGMIAGDKVYFEYQAIYPARPSAPRRRPDAAPTPRRAAPRRAAPRRPAPRCAPPNTQHPLTRPATHCALARPCPRALARVVRRSRGVIGSRLPLVCMTTTTTSNSARSTVARRWTTSPTTTSTFPTTATISWASSRARTTGRVARCSAPRSR